MYSSIFNPFIIGNFKQDVNTEKFQIKSCRVIHDIYQIEVTEEILKHLFSSKPASEISLIYFKFIYFSQKNLQWKIARNCLKLQTLMKRLREWTKTKTDR